MNIKHLLSRESSESFHNRGFLSISDFLDSRELENVRSWIDEIASWADSPQTKGHHHFEQTAEGERVLARSENIIPFHDGIRELLTNGKVIQAISELFGEPAVLFKEKINYKLPGGAGFAPHQDVTAYKYGTVHITCLIAVDDSNEDNGCLWFAAGHHQAGILEEDNDGCLPAEFAKTLEWQSTPVSAGGAVFFDSFAPHKSEANRSQTPRRAMYVTYTKLSEGDFRQQYYEDRQKRIEAFEKDNPDSARISTIGHFRGDIVK